MNKETLQQNLRPLAASALEHFKKLLSSIALFHGAFLSLIAGEVLLIALFFTFLVKSALVALSIGLLVLTIFCYSVLKIWVYTKKRQDFAALSKAFEESIKRLMGDEPTTSFDHVFILSRALLTLSDTLKKDRGAFLDNSRPFLKPFLPLLSLLYQKLIKKDLLFVQEEILSRTVQLWLSFIRTEPTHLEAHASLASTYITFSTLFDAKKERERFTALMQKAAEEFKILSDYAPSDVWVHMQLAYTYHDLNMRAAEIKEYEAILQLQPGDSETLFKLGVLYFQEGYTAKALSLYEELKKLSPEKSQQLISFYA